MVGCMALTPMLRRTLAGSQTTTAFRSSIAVRSDPETSEQTEETQNAIRRHQSRRAFREQKEKESDRDYSGTLKIGGVEYWLSGWIKTSKKGAKYLSLAVKPKDAPAADQTLRDSMDDGISF
jgi:hypothetical protein